ncbi:MAG: hypothetical protein KFB97_02695 [Cyanobium sp. M30B3]|nr:MAG: hypothetical protein KFB97_02695 [Cyanobium sp. M30B3]
MVNASLNWASIVGIVLAVGGALLYFMRSFKPALARDYDVFFAAVGLLCGGILFFQGWRLDPILQFGQFLLAGTTVFFAYESVRLRGVTTEQARRSSYFDDDEPLPAPPGPYRPRVGGRSWDEPERERFDEPLPVRRRIPSRDDDGEDADAFYRPSRSSRAAIPERAASRRGADWESPSPERESPADQRRYTAGASRDMPEFGARRRDGQAEVRRGSRPTASSEAMPRSSRRPPGSQSSTAPSDASRPGIPQGSPIRAGRAPGTATPRTDNPRTDSARTDSVSDADFTPVRPAASREATPSRGRDNSSRFDD